MKKSEKMVSVVPKITFRIGKPPRTKLVAPGKSCDVSCDEAADLYVRGFIKSYDEKAVRRRVEVEPSTPSISVVNSNSESERVDAIIDAIADMDQTKFGKDKKPDVREIEKIMGEDITAADRDKAWTKYKTLLDGD